MAQRLSTLGLAVLMLGVSSAGRALAESVPPMVTQVCSGCHGIDGNSVIPTIPKLAGRHPQYLMRELKDFAAGKRHSDVMNPIAATIDPDDASAIAEYFGKQKPTSEPVADPVAAALGAKLFLDGDEGRGVPACAGCHEDDASGSKRFPRLAGQHRDYLIDQMMKFRTNFHTYAAAKFMREVTQRLSEDEIRAVADYLSAK